MQILVEKLECRHFKISRMKRKKNQGRRGQLILIRIQVWNGSAWTNGGLEWTGVGWISRGWESTDSVRCWPGNLGWRYRRRLQPPAPPAQCPPLQLRHPDHSAPIPKIQPHHESQPRICSPLKITKIEPTWAAVGDRPHLLSWALDRETDRIQRSLYTHSEGMDIL